MEFGELASSRLPPDRGAGLLFRISVFTGINLVLAVAAHRLCGGQVDEPSLWLAFGGCVGAGTWVTRRRRRLPTAMTVVILSQIALHVLLAELSRSGSARTPETSRPSTAMLRALLFCHSGASSLTDHQVWSQAARLGLTHSACVSSAAGMSGMHASSSMLVPSPGMLLGHAIAALMTAWFLARGDAWCWRLASSVVERVLAVVPELSRPLARPAVAVVIGGVVLDLRATTRSGRGPPLLTCC